MQYRRKSTVLKFARISSKIRVMVVIKSFRRVAEKNLKTTPISVDFDVVVRRATESE